MLVRGIRVLVFFVPLLITFLSTHDGLIAQEPRVVQPGWEIELFAEAPQIVTPVGIAMHPQGGVLVVESHTHSPPSDYEGPQSDQIVRLVDSDGDGLADRRETFADGFEDAMNLIVDADGMVYVVQRDRVFRLQDDDGDGYANRIEELLRLETPQSFDHSGLLGIAFAPDGRLLVSRGNVGGAPFTFHAADSSRIEGYGDGGDIVVLSREGTDLQPFATGFWNPFAMFTDGEQGSWCVDNDPDAVGPNRLVYLIEGGDYGYRAAYGSSGRWPLSAWDGELPGTLPLAAGTGEAPSGIAAVRYSDQRADDLVVTSWGEHRIDLFRPLREGAAIVAARIPLIEGNDDFRPVAIVAAGDGSFYVTDWVRKDYPNHGEGRIWRLRYRGRLSGEESVPEPLPKATLSRYQQALGKFRDPEFFAEERAPLLANPFVLSVCVDSWSTLPAAALRERYASQNALVRVTALLAAARQTDRAGGGAAAEDQSPLWKEGLADEDLAVRLAALRAAAKLGDATDRTALRSVLNAGPVNANLVSVFLAADEALSEDAIERAGNRIRGMSVRRRFDSETIRGLLQEGELPAEVLAFLISLAEAEVPDQAAKFARELLVHDELPVRREAVWTLARSAGEEAVADLQSVLDSKTEASVVRADALALAAPHLPVAQIMDYLQDEDEPVVYEALRSLRGREDASLAATLGAEFRSLSQMLKPKSWIAEVYPELTGEERAPRPRDLETWNNAVAGAGDADAGRRVFFSDAAQCSACHRVAARGGIIGPELTAMQRGHSKDSFLKSIYAPSEEISPEYQTHVLVTEAGELVTGIQFHYRSGGKAISIIPQDGEERRFAIDELDAYGPSPKSLMPDGLLDNLTISEVRDLLAFLEQP